MIVPVSFSTTSAAIAKVRTDMLAQGYTGPVLFGAKYLKQRRDPTTGGAVVGSVVVVPAGRSPVNAPRLLGGNPRPTFTVSRALQIHCWANAPIGSFVSQYEADYTAAEILSSFVLRSFEILIPGAKRGGTSEQTEVGETTFGVEIITNMAIDLETPDTTYALATGAVFAQGVLMEFPDGHTESGSDP